MTREGDASLLRVGLDPLENTAWNVVSEVDLSTILAKVQRKSM